MLFAKTKNLIEVENALAISRHLDTKLEPLEDQSSAAWIL